MKKPLHPDVYVYCVVLSVIHIRDCGLQGAFVLRCRQDESWDTGSEALMLQGWKSLHAPYKLQVIY